MREAATSSRGWFNRRAVAAAASSLLLSSSGWGSLINFDPDGAGGNTTKQIGTFAFLPGSSLMQNVAHFHEDTATFPLGSTFNFDVYLQARVGNLLDVTNTPVAVSGFNTGGFELTAVTHFTATATRTSATKFTISLPPVGQQTSNFFEIYYDPNAGTKANDLAGTGFNDVSTTAKQIFSGKLISITPTSNISVDTSSIDLFDQYDADGDNYGGMQSIFSGGNLKFNTSVDSVDSSFFTDSMSTFTFNTSLQSPFSSVDPGAQFSGAAGGRTASDTTYVLPDAGSGAQSSKTNGLTGTGLEDQSFANGTFTAVPEPASLLGLAAFAGGLMPRRRSRTRSSK